MMVEVVGYKAIARVMGISLSKFKSKHAKLMWEHHILLKRRVHRKGRSYPHYEVFTWENRIQAYCSIYMQEYGPL